MIRTTQCNGQCAHVIWSIVIGNWKWVIVTITYPVNDFLCFGLHFSTTMKNWKNSSCVLILYAAYRSEKANRHSDTFGVSLLLAITVFHISDIGFANHFAETFCSLHIKRNIIKWRVNLKIERTDLYCIYDHKEDFFKHYCRYFLIAQYVRCKRIAH